MGLWTTMQFIQGAVGTAAGHLRQPAIRVILSTEDNNNLHAISVGRFPSPGLHVNVCSVIEQNGDRRRSSSSRGDMQRRFEMFALALIGIDSGLHPLTENVVTLGPIVAV